MVLDKVTFLQAVMELSRLLPELPLAPPGWAAGTSHISGASELLFVPKHKREHIPVSPLHNSGRSIMGFIKNHFRLVIGCPLQILLLTFLRWLHFCNWETL